MLFKILVVAAILAAVLGAQSFPLKKKNDKDFVTAILDRASKGIKLNYKVV